MRTTVTLDASHVSEILKITKARSKAKAVETAVRKFIEDARWRRLWSRCGTWKFHPGTADWRHSER